MQRLFCVLLLCAAMCLGQDAEQVRMERNGATVTLTAETFRPVDALARALLERFHVPVSTEDPLWRYPGDLRDMSEEMPDLRKGALAPRGGKLVFSFEVGGDGSIGDQASVMRSLVTAIHAQLPFRYRLDEEDERYTLVPVRARNEQGEMADVTPLLDRPVTIAFSKRRVRDYAALLVESLSAQTGLRVSCCEGAIAGLPWGMEEIAFGATDLPAREVLKQLMYADRGRRQLWFSWCDTEFCFIYLRQP